MTKALRVPDYLNHILQAIARINRYTANMDEAGCTFLIRFFWHCQIAIANTTMQSLMIIFMNESNGLRHRPQLAR